MIGMMVKVKDVKTRSELEKIINDQELHISEQEKNIENLEIENERIKKALSDTLATSSDFEIMFEEIADENKALHEKIGQQNKENDELRALIAKLQEKNDVTEVSLSDSMKALQMMTEKLRDERQRNAELEKALANAKKFKSNKSNPKHNAAFQKMADLLCEELLLLEDDMKLVGSLQLPENKEDPYKSNAGRVMKQRSPYPSLSEDGDLAAAEVGENATEPITIKTALNELTNVADTRTPTRTPMNKSAPLRQYGHGDGLSLLAGGIMGSPVLEDVDMENCNDDDDQ